MDLFDGVARGGVFLGLWFLVPWINKGSFMCHSFLQMELNYGNGSLGLS